MSYAAVADMVTRFGQNELIRLTTPDGQALTAIDQAAVDLALNDSSALIDSHLRKRYLTPVTPVPAELSRAACIMARYDLCFGENKEPPEQVRLARKEVMEWLASIRDGRTVLADATPSGNQSFAMVQDRGFTTVADDGDATGSNAYSPQQLPPGYGFYGGC